MTPLIDTQYPLVFEAVGVFGFTLYVLNYSLLTLHRLTSTDPMYFAINLAAASMVLTGLLVSFNLAAALIQLFWVAISTAAILIRLRRGRLGAARATGQALTPP